MLAKKVNLVSVFLGMLLAGGLLSIMGMTATAIPKAHNGSSLPVLTNPDLSLMSILTSGSEVGGPGIIEGAPGDTGILVDPFGVVADLGIITIINVGDASVDIISFSSGTSTTLGTVPPGRTTAFGFATSGDISFSINNDGTTGKFAFVVRPDLP